jgi:hypothetical protein
LNSRGDRSKLNGILRIQAFVKPKRLWIVTLAAASSLCAAASGGAQAGAQAAAQASSQRTEPHARQMIESAVQSELAAARNDHSSWAYRDHDRSSDKNAVYQVVETPAGTIRRMIERDGRPLDAGDAGDEAQRIRTFVSDPDAQAKQRKAGVHDDQQAREMLLMLPNAYIWNIKSETPELATLEFRPNPEFHAPNYEARVMGTMAGEMVIVKSDNRIRTLRGALTEDVKFGFGVFGKLHQGGTFDVERREVAPHHWQITETHVHIDGRALLFKTIGQQEDEIKTEWKPSAATTLEAAAKQLGVN